MRTIGVVLAGGRSTRFGSDKAEAIWRGHSLIRHAAIDLAQCCDGIAISGRNWSGLVALDDWPRPGLGPLGGLAAGLRYAAKNGFEQVLSAPVDCVGLPCTLRDILEPAPSFLEAQPVIGLWPVGALDVLEKILGYQDRRSLQAFARAIDARPVSVDEEICNINTREDLALWVESQGSG